VLTLATVHCFAFMDRMLLALLAPLVKTTLHLADFETGLLLGASFVLSYAVASWVFRTLADRFHRIRLVACSLLLSGLATIGCGLASGFESLALARMGLGLAQSLLAPAALSLITQAIPPSHLGRGVSLFTSGATLGRSMALLFGGGVLAAFQALLFARHVAFPAWRLVFVVFGLATFVLALALFRFAEPARASSAPGQAATSALKDWLLRHRSFFATHTIIASATVLVLQTITAWTTTLLARRFGVSVAVAGSTFGIVVLIAPLGHVLGGAILDRIDRRMGLLAPGVIMTGSLLATTALTALLAFAPAYSVALVGLLGASLALGIASPAGFTAVQRGTPAHLRGRATAIFLVCVTSIGFGLGPPTLGLLTDRVFGAARIGAALFLIIAVATAISSIAVAVQWRHAGSVPVSR
jgi:MFS family permease